MKKEAGSIASACALGAWIGGISSLYIGDHWFGGQYLWIIGSLFGGLIGYITVNFKKFYQGILGAYKTFVDWKPNKSWWKNASVCFFASILGWIYFVAAQIGMIFSTEPKPIFNFTFFGIFVLIGFISFVSIIFALYAMDNSKSNFVLGPSIAGSRKFLIRWNPICAPFFVLYYGVKLIAIALGRIPSATKKLKNFCWAVFVNVHSTVRMICFVDSMIGGMVGYHWHFPVLGASVGALLGLVNYYLISIRWLKLKPTF